MESRKFQSLHNLLALTSQRILECCAVQLLSYTRSPYLKRHLHYCWKFIYLQDTSELSNLALSSAIWVFIQTLHLEHSFVLPLFCLWALWSWGGTSGKQSYKEEMINSTLQWFPRLWVKLNVCFLVKSHQKNISFLFHTHLDWSRKHSSVLPYVAKGRLAAMTGMIR